MRTPTHHYSEMYCSTKKWRGRARVGPIISCRFAFLPPKQLSDSSNITETTMAASLG